MTWTIASLTSSIAAGDPAALTHFFETWFEPMYSGARRLTGRDESFCLDVVQDAMMRVIRSMKRMDTEDALSAWIAALVKSCAIDRMRQDARRREREKRAARQRGHAGGAEHDERLQWLERELASLETLPLTLLRLRHQLGFTLRQTGRVVGMSAGAVDGRLSRLLAALRERASEQLE